MRAYIFENREASAYGQLDTIIIIAHSESEARELINDYDTRYDLDESDYDLIASKPLNKGVIAYIAP